MDGLDEFEKQLAADKAQREKHHDAKHRRHHHGDEASKHGTRRHRERHDEHHHHHDGSKRRRVSQHGGRKHHDSSPRRSEKHGETIDAKHEGLKRDAWMTAPSALDVEYIQSRGPDSRPSGPPREEPQRVVHARELNRALVDDDAAKHTDSCPETRDDDSAAPGTLDDSATPKTLDDSATPKTLDASALNRLRAQMIKAKLRRAPNAAQLEQEYQAAASCQAAAPAPAPVVLGAMHSRQLAGSSRGEVKPVMTRRGRERGQVEQNDELSIGDMVAEERRTKGQVGGEGARLAERIARDGRFQDNLEYMDDQAAKLARHVERNDAAIRSAAVADLHKVSAAIDSCRLCHDSDRGGGPVAPVVSLGTRVYLTLAPAPQVSPGSAVIVPLAHHANLVGCDDDEWEEMRNFMKSLTRMYHEQGREVVFYEDAAFARGAAHRRHACLYAVPIPYDQGALAPAHFRQAFLAAGDEWSQHAKVISTADGGGGGSGGGLRRRVAAQAPYFHVWFDLDGGMAHIVDDAEGWPGHDGFGRGVVGGIVGAEAHIVKKRPQWRGDEEQRARVDEWKTRWRKFDWTRLLQTCDM